MKIWISGWWFALNLCWSKKSHWLAAFSRCVSLSVQKWWLPSSWRVAADTRSPLPVFFQEGLKSKFVLTWGWFQGAATVSWKESRVLIYAAWIRCTTSGKVWRLAREGRTPLPQPLGSSASCPVEWRHVKPPGSHLSKSGFPCAAETTARKKWKMMPRPQLQAIGNCDSDSFKSEGNCFLSPKRSRSGGNYSCVWLSNVIHDWSRFFPCLCSASNQTVIPLVLKRGLLMAEPCIYFFSITHVCIDM